MVASFDYKLFYARKNKNINKNHIYKLCGVSNILYDQMESGLLEVSGIEPEIIRKLAKLFEVEPTYLDEGYWKKIDIVGTLSFELSDLKELVIKYHRKKDR